MRSAWTGDTKPDVMIRNIDAPKLVVSDVDGTLVDSRDRVSQRMREAVRRISSAGVHFTLATGRPARWLLPVLEQLPMRPRCVCANGAVVYDAAADRIVHSAELGPEVLRHVVDIAERATQDIGGVGFAVERVGESAFDRAESLFSVSEQYDHAWLSDEHSVQTIAQLIEVPVVKLLIRNSGVTSAQLYDLVAPHIDPAVAHATFSWSGGLVEVSAPGISKRSALEWIAEDLGVRSDEVIAFGDMPNDIEMLRWAGCGVAMGNALDRVKDAADTVTADNDSDGVAAVLENWF